VVLNKIDLVTPKKLKLVVENLKERLYFAHPFPLFLVSAKTGQGINRLRKALQDRNFLHSLQLRRDNR